MAGIKDVAEAAGVSIEAVSRVKKRANIILAADNDCFGRRLYNFNSFLDVELCLVFSFF